MIVADIHEELLDVMQKAGIDYLTRRQFTLADALNVREFNMYSEDVMNCVYCNGVEAHEDNCLRPAAGIVGTTINGAIARLEKEES